MAMKTASPWWFSALFAAGLFLLFLGERPFDHLESVRLVFSGLGTVTVMAITGLRFYTFSKAKSDLRAVERTLLIAQVGALIALLLYVTTTSWGRGLIGIDDLTGQDLTRALVPLTVLWSIGLLVALIPILMIELSLGTSRRGELELGRIGDAEPEAVEAFRVREMASSGLTIALALAFLFVTCNVAQQRNTRVDVSYFKTASPGEATINIVKSVSKPVRVYLFFPEINEVKNQMRGYFKALAEATGNLELEVHDQLLAAKLANEFKVNENGHVVIAYGDKHEKKKFTIDLKRNRRNQKSRTELRDLDRTINATMMKVVKERRTAYLTVGHGELNDPDSDWVKRKLLSSELKKRLRELNYKVSDLSVSNGLGKDIPDDADLVMILGPKATFAELELASISRYLDQGGRLMVALDPVYPDAGLGLLEQHLGLTFEAKLVTDDIQHVRGRIPSLADRRLIKTNRFSSHASVSTLSRAGMRYGTAFVNAGLVKQVPLDEAHKDRVKRSYVVRSMQTGFLDLNNNLVFDKGTEKRDQIPIVAAAEDPTAVPEGSGTEDNSGADNSGTDEGKAEHAGMRAMVFADVDIFTDKAQKALGGADVLFIDAVKWLGDEEELAGEIISERDVIIAHTRNEDILWFYSTIVGAPLVVLGFGLWFGRRRRKRETRSES